MANQKITQLNSIAWSSVDANNDVIPIVDVNDTSMAPSGTTKKISAAELISSLVPKSRTITINGTTQDLTADRTWNISTGITVGTTPVTSGTDGRLFFQAGGVVQQDAALFWDNTNKRLGIGATPDTSTRLDVRAQGALSTDIAFRIRNSANTSNLFEVNGIGTTTIRTQAIIYAAAASTPFGIVDPTNSFSNFEVNTAGQLFLRGTGAPTIRMFDGSINLRLIGGPNSQLKHDVNLSFVNSSNVTHSTMTTNGIWNYVTGYGLYKNTALTVSSVVDSFSIYASDVVAGNSAPHFRTENGDIVKLYRVGGWGLPTGTLTRTTFDSGTVTLAELAERVAALITDLRDSHGLLKA